MDQRNSLGNLRFSFSCTTEQIIKCLPVLCAHLHVDENVDGRRDRLTGVGNRETDGNKVAQIWICLVEVWQNRHGGDREHIWRETADIDGADERDGAHHTVFLTGHAFVLFGRRRSCIGGRLAPSCALVEFDYQENGAKHDYRKADQ